MCLSLVSVERIEIVAWNQVSHICSNVSRKSESTTDYYTDVNFNFLGGDSLIRINWNPSSIIIWRARRPSRRLCHLRKPLVPWVLRNRHPLHLMRKAVQWDRRSIILTVQRRVIKVAHRYHQEDHLCRNRHNSLHLSNRIIRLIHSRCHLIWVRRYDRFIKNHIFVCACFIFFRIAFVIYNNVCLEY